MSYTENNFENAITDKRKRNFYKLLLDENMKKKNVGMIDCDL